MSKYFDGELLSAYENLNKEFECKKENVELHKKIVDLKTQLALTEKALELACNDLIDCVVVCEYCKFDEYEKCPMECSDNLIILKNYFKTKAKEMKSELGR